MEELPLVRPNSNDAIAAEVVGHGHEESIVNTEVIILRKEPLSNPLVRVFEIREPESALVSKPGKLSPHEEA